MKTKYIIIIVIVLLIIIAITYNNYRLAKEGFGSSIFYKADPKLTEPIINK